MAVNTSQLPNYIKASKFVAFEREYNVLMQIRRDVERYHLYEKMHRGEVDVFLSQ